MKLEEQDVTSRARKHAALADPVRLAVVDHLTLGDASPSELQRLLDLPSNLLAHHLKVLAEAGIAARRQSQGDRRRSYLTLVPGGLDDIAVRRGRSEVISTAPRLVFVCTANSARSQLATTLWRRASSVPSASAGTHPAARIAPGAIAAARRHGLSMSDESPRHLDEVLRQDDVIITVCDNAHEELHGRAAVHWAVPDPVASDTDEAFDAAVADLTRRITTIAAITA